MCDPDLSGPITIDIGSLRCIADSGAHQERRPAALTVPVDNTSVQGCAGGEGRWGRQRERLAKMPWYRIK